MHITLNTLWAFTFKQFFVHWESLVRFQYFRHFTIFFFCCIQIFSVCGNFGKWNNEWKNNISKDDDEGIAKRKKNLSFDVKNIAEWKISLMWAVLEKSRKKTKSRKINTDFIFFSEKQVFSLNLCSINERKKYRKIIKC